MDGLGVGAATLRHSLQLCNKCNKVALWHESMRVAVFLDRRGRWARALGEACRDTARYISAQQSRANRRNMGSSSIHWHAVRFIPGIGNLQGIGETVAWWAAVARVGTFRQRAGRAPQACRYRPGGSLVQTSGRHRLSARDTMRPCMTIARPSRLRAVASPRQESTPSRAHVFALVDVVGPPTFFRKRPRTARRMCVGKSIG